MIPIDGILKSSMIALFPQDFTSIERQAISPKFKISQDIRLFTLNNTAFSNRAVNY